MLKFKKIHSMEKKQETRRKKKNNLIPLFFTKE